MGEIRMPNNESANLPSSEYSALGRAMLDMIASYPEMPASMEYDYQDLKNVNHIGFFTTPGGRYLKRDVTGSFAAQLTFEIAYKIRSTNNSGMLKAEELMNGLADYLETMRYPSLTGDRQILEIVMNSQTYRSAAEADGSVTYVRSGLLKYEKE